MNKLILLSILLLVPMISADNITVINYTIVINNTYFYNQTFNYTINETNVYNFTNFTCINCSYYNVTNYTYYNVTNFNITNNITPVNYQSQIDLINSQLGNMLRKSDFPNLAALENQTVVTDWQVQDTYFTIGIVFSILIGIVCIAMIIKGGVG